MQGKVVTQEEASKIFYQILEMQLPGTKEQVWATLTSERYNSETTIDRLLNQNFAKPAFTEPTQKTAAQPQQQQAQGNNQQTQ